MNTDTGPTLPATPEDAYAEGRKDEREQCIAACAAVMNAYGGDPAGRLLSSERVRMQHQLQASGAAQCIDAICSAQRSPPQGFRLSDRLGAPAGGLCQPEGLKFDAFGEPRTRYVRVTLNRSHCVMHPSDGDCYVEDARNAGDPDWERYIVRDVWLSEREFEDLPEHDGF
jgi:hypothetical protein